MLQRLAVLACLVVSARAFADDADTAASGYAVVPPSVTMPLAAPSPDEVPAPPPPQNEPWSNVSHINGVPVPVGERNRYLYKYKHTNLQVNPFGLVIGFYDVAASRALTPNLALSVELSMVHFNGDDAGQVAASLPIYFKRTFNGPYLEPGLVIRNESFGCGDCGYSSSTAVQLEMMFGWSWMFDSGLNLSAALGLTRTLNQDSYDLGDSIGPAGYFRVGYAF
jgi:hypothetical protein